MTSSPDYLRGLIDGFTRATDFLIAAPTSSFGQRRAEVAGGFPRVLDSAVDPDGDPDIVHCTYALRDAVLGWIWPEVDAAKDALAATKNGSSTP